MECLNCNEQLSEKGFFCSKCGTQNKCKKCGEMLEKDANACIYCGEEVIQKGAVSTTMNTIEFAETKNSRNFKASFTDRVGESITSSFGILMTNKIIPKKSNVLHTNSLLGRASTEETIDAEVVEEQSELPPDLLMLKKIFKTDGERTSLSETRLKAQSKRDYGIRLSIIFLYYKKLLGIENVPRKDLKSILDNASVEDANLRHWIANNPFIGTDGNFAELKAGGVDAAKKYLIEMSNTELKDKWQIGATSKSGRKTKDKKQGKTQTEEE